MMAMMDIWKCFDQIIPVLARLLLGLAGMPTSILWAYTRLMAEVKIVNCLSMGIGETYRRTCNIPQGCPWSMAVLALMTRPWILMIKATTQTVPRALADDLAVWARAEADPHAEPHEWKQRWHATVNNTIEYIVAIGARTAQYKQG